MSMLGFHLFAFRELVHWIVDAENSLGSFNILVCFQLSFEKCLVHMGGNTNFMVANTIAGTNFMAGSIFESGKRLAWSVL